MPSSSCFSLSRLRCFPHRRRRRRHDNDDNSQPTGTTGQETWRMSPVTSLTVDQRVRPQPRGSASAPRRSIYTPSSACSRGETSAIALRNSQQEPTIPSTSESRIQPDLWGAAMATLSDDEKTYIHKANRDLSLPTISIVNEMIKLATEKQQECENTGWRTYHLGGHTFSLGDLARKTIICLNKFKEIGDIIVQYDPGHAALPWAAARLLLQAWTMAGEQMAAFITVIERVTRIIFRCQVFERLYNRNTLDHDVAENFQSALIELYALVLRSMNEAIGFISESTVSRSISAFLQPSKGSGLLGSLENGEIRIQQEVAACEGQLRANADARTQEQLRSLLELSIRTDKNVQNILQRMDTNELIQILQWISPIAYRNHHDLVKELRTKDTCAWLLERRTFGQWWNANSTLTLWLQGIPGAGKTHLTSRVIEEIEEVLSRSGSDEGSAFFYCNRNEGDRRNALAILRSYVRQLSTTPNRPDFIHPKLKQLYMNSQREGSGWTLELCKKCLIELFNLYPGTILVLDALDECEPEERTTLLDFFVSIPMKTSKPVRIFISSRPEGDIRQRLAHIPKIEIQATDNENDIAKFVRESIEKNGRWRDALNRNPDLKDSIIKTLLKKSQGMFQWAALQIYQLLNLLTEPEISNRLGKLPEGLKAAYDEIFKKIETLETPASTISFRALRWIMCAAKPLSSEKLLAAVRIDPEEELFESFEPTEAHILDWCANLVRLDYQEKPPVWRVCHLSVVEYLETRWPQSEAHCFVAKASLVLLQEPYQIEQGQEGRMNVPLRRDHPLQKYVDDHWSFHVQTQEHENADPKLVALLKSFLGSLTSSSMQYREWFQRASASHYSIRKGNVYDDYESIAPATSTIFLACLFSLYALLRDWWETLPSEWVLSQVNDDGDDLFRMAAYGGSKAICTRMWEMKLPLNREPFRGKYGSVLEAAIHSKSIETIEFLINQGADINMQLWTGYYGSALAAAVVHESIEITKLLIDYGADINMQLRIRDYGSALVAAAHTSTETTKLLIDHGADINIQAQVGDYGSALAAAAFVSTETTKLLIDHGADINMQVQAGDFGSALAAAAANALTYTAKLHIEHEEGVDMQFLVGDDGSILPATAYESTETLKLLIEHGADVNMQLQAGRYGSALAAAIDDESIETTKLLIDHGADVDMQLQVGEYGSALVAAIANHSPYITKLLVNHGADVNMQLQIGKYGSALAAAAYTSTETTKLLIDHGADVNVQLQIGDYSSALAAAIVACRGSMGTTKLLVDQGADFNLPIKVKGLLYADALAFATSKRESGVAAFLIDRGARIHEPRLVDSL